MAAMRVEEGRTPVGYFNIVSETGQDMGWVGYCPAISEAMINAIFHPGGVDAAESRALTDPPKVLGNHNGEVFVPHSWISHAMTTGRDRLVINLMKAAAEKAYAETKNELAAAPNGTITKKHQGK